MSTTPALSMFEMRVVVSKDWEGNHLSDRTVHRSKQINDSFRPNVMNRTDVVKTRAHIRKLGVLTLGCRSPNVSILLCSKQP